MADGVSWQLRQEWHQMLINLKTTVEGLLATPTTNVWNTYGGLSRLAADIDKIMFHRLRVTHVPGKVGSGLDYWNFVRGLRWLSPVMAPSVEQLAKYTERSRGQQKGEGQAWLRHSLMNHSLSAQLQVLVGNRQHLMQHYWEDAYLSQPQYFKVMTLCLQAVEQNRAALLADINPILLTRKNPRKKCTHSRSASLPVNQVSDSVLIQRNNTHDHLAPPTWVSPKTESVLMASAELALPISTGCSPDESAKDALLQVLNKSGDSVDDGDYDFYGDDPKKHDPLMNVEIMMDADFKLPNRSSSHSNIHSVAELDRSIEKSNHRMRASQQGRVNPVLDNILNTEEQQSENTSQQVSSEGRVEGRERSQSLIVTAAAAVIMEESEPTKKESESKVKKNSHYRSMSDYGVGAGNGEPLPSPTDSLSSSLPPRTLEGYTLAGKGSKEGSAFFPQPSKGQSLISFLSSQDFHTCAELDKENAHFSISEALIAAIEQMKWNQVIRPQRDSEADHEEGDSDEEIQQLKQRIRIRRRERMKEKARGFPAFSDGRTDSTAASLSPPATCSSTTPSLSDSSMSQDSSSSDEDDFHDTEINDLDSSHTPESNLSTLREGGLSLSLGSLYSEADIHRNNQTMERVLQRQGSITEGTGTLTSSHMSAESVAISLIKKFSQKHLPKASELDWLVSEQDAPQALLPLPNSYPVSPDEGENSDLLHGMRTRLRGNLEWAPPRAQIIFNIHPPPKKKVVLAKQNYRCAGCGAKVEPGYMKRYRYCEYLGKFFCPRCHTNEMSFVPSRILRKWDFTRYHVSNFARDVLSRIHRDPLFNIKDINPALYRKVKLLDSVRECRVQLSHLKVFLKTCRFGQKLLQKVKATPSHWTEDIHGYSLGELLQVKKGEMLPQLKSLVNESVQHTSQCLLCQAKGFICEICNDGTDIIFPFELNRVIQCKVCRACFHSTCFNPDNCPKCARIESRRHKMATTSPQTSPSDESVR